MTARVARLRAEIASDRRAFEVRAEELAGLDLSASPPAGDVARAAVALHHAYGAIEAAFERVHRFFEDSSPEGPDWHQALLDAMALEIEGMRPAVIGRETHGSLRLLLSFRHFFRHAYAVGLDAGRLEELRRRVGLLAPGLADDLDRFDRVLASLVE